MFKKSLCECLLRKSIYLWNLTAASLTQNVKSPCVALVPINYTLHWIKFPKNTQLCVDYTYFHLGKEKIKMLYYSN